MVIKIWAERDKYKKEWTLPEATVDNWEMCEEVNSDKYSGAYVGHSSKEIYVQLGPYSDFLKLVEWVESKITTM